MRKIYQFITFIKNINIVRNSRIDNTYCNQRALLYVYII